MITARSVRGISTSTSRRAFAAAARRSSPQPPPGAGSSDPGGVSSSKKEPSSAATAADLSSPPGQGSKGVAAVTGTVNDTVRFPAPNKAHGSYHWTFERLVSVGLVPLTVMPFASAGSMNPSMDAVLVSALIVHSHIGFDSCIVDYIPRRKYGTLAGVAKWALRAGTVLAFVGFYEFQTNDVGATEAIKRVWRA